MSEDEDKGTKTYLKKTNKRAKKRIENYADNAKLLASVGYIGEVSSKNCNCVPNRLPKGKILIQPHEL